MSICSPYGAISQVRVDHFEGELSWVNLLVEQSSSLPYMRMVRFILSPFSH